MIITICGRPGSGKSSVGRSLAERLGYRYYDIGEMRGEMARERGMSIEQFNRLGETEDFTDRKVDEFQEELGKKEDNLVVVSRLGAHFIPHSFRVFLNVGAEEGGRRVFHDSMNRKDETYSSIEEARIAVQEREKSDIRRYEKYYGYDPFDERGYDLVIDTTEIGIDEVVKRVAEAFEKWKV